MKNYSLVLSVSPVSETPNFEDYLSLLKFIELFQIFDPSERQVLI